MKCENIHTYNLHSGHRWSGNCNLQSVFIQMSRLYGIRDPVSIGKSTTFKLDKMKIKWRALKHSLSLYLHAHRISILSFRTAKRKDVIADGNDAKIGCRCMVAIVKPKPPILVAWYQRLFTLSSLVTVNGIASHIFHLIRWQNNTTLPSLICKSTPCTSQADLRITCMCCVYVCFVLPKIARISKSVDVV